MSPKIRQALYPDDYQALARLAIAALPEWPTTAEALEEQDSVRNQKFHFIRFVAENAPQNIVGFSSAGHDTFSYSPEKYVLRIFVQPDAQRHGIGTALLQTTETHLKARQAKILQSMISNTHPEGIVFATQHGYKEWWRRIESRLNTKDFDFAKYQALENFAASQAIKIKTYNQLAEDPLRDQKIWELDDVLNKEIPYGQTFTPTTLEQFQKELLHNQDFIPEACFVALKDNRYIGFSCMSKSAAGFLIINMTGVLKPFRNNGLAKLLKAKGIRYAQEHGYTEIRTHNDAPNTAMLGLNASLGFERFSELIRVQKILGQT